MGLLRTSNALNPSLDRASSANEPPGAHPHPHMLTWRTSARLASRERSHARLVLLVSDWHDVLQILNYSPHVGSQSALARSLRGLRLGRRGRGLSPARLMFKVFCAS